MTERTVPPNPYQSEPRMVQSPDAYLMQMNRQIGENTNQLNSLMGAFSDHIKKGEVNQQELQVHLAALRVSMDNINIRAADNPEQIEWLRQKIQADKDRHAVLMDALKKVVSGTIWAGLIGLGTLIWYGLTHVMEKGGG